MGSTSTAAFDPGRLAVYGSLLRAEKMLQPLGVEGYLEYLGPALIPGELFDLGPYPALRSGTSGTPPKNVSGELFQVLDPRAYAILDEYEGSPPENPAPEHAHATSFFRREVVELAHPRLAAWVYLYHGELNGRPEIVGVSWTEYKARPIRR